MAWDNETVVSAAVDSAVSHGAALEGIRSNVSAAGRVELHHLRFAEAGDYDLSFNIGARRQPAASTVLTTDCCWVGWLTDWLAWLRWLGYAGTYCSLCISYYPMADLLCSRDRSG